MPDTVTGQGTEACECAVPQALHHTAQLRGLDPGDQGRPEQDGDPHGSRQQADVYEVYGRYVEGLERDRLKIFSYFGLDFKRGE